MFKSMTSNIWKSLYQFQFPSNNGICYKLHKMTTTAFSHFQLRLPAICSSSPGWGENINFIWRQVHSPKELHVLPMSVNFFQISMIPMSTYCDHIPRACKWNYLLKIKTPHLLRRVVLNNKHLLARVKVKRAHLDRLGDGRILNRNWNYFLGPEPVCSFFFCQSKFFLKYIWLLFAS